MNENTYELRSMDLFTGLGGSLIAGSMLGWRPVCLVEIEPFAQRILIQRMQEGSLPPTPIWPDAGTFDAKPWAGSVDILVCGPPCQGFSVAGKGLGAADPRNQIPTVLRILRDLECPRLYLENSANLVSFDYFGQILGQLAELGFNARWSTLSAAACGANHKRNRLWLYAWKR